MRLLRRLWPRHDLLHQSLQPPRAGPAADATAGVAAGNTHGAAAMGEGYELLS